MCLSFASDRYEVVAPTQLTDKRRGIMKIEPGKSQVVLFMKSCQSGPFNMTKQILPVHLDREELVARCEQEEKILF